MENHKVFMKRAKTNDDPAIPSLTLDHSVANQRNEMVSASNPLNSEDDSAQNVRRSLFR
jgi:hypothetical protein